MTAASVSRPLPPRPFHPSAYSQARRVAQVGFPTSTRGGTVRPWIPGISTPEGIVLVTGVVVAASAEDFMSRILHVAATGVVAATVIGVPSVVTYLVHLPR